MPASKPSAAAARSEQTLDCHTDALLLREGLGAVASSYLRRSSSGHALGTQASTTEASASVSLATPTTASEPPENVLRDRVFRAAATFAVRPAARPARAPAPLRIRARDVARPVARASASPTVPLAALAASRAPLVSVAAFALGASFAALGGSLADRALELAAIACVGAGVTLLAAARRRG